MKIKSLFRLSLVVALLLVARTSIAQPVTQIAAGGFHSLFLTGDGKLWGMGENPFGQLGDGNYILNSPFGTNQPVPTLTSNVVAIAAGDHHSLFLQRDGSLWGMGLNNFGQLGDGVYTGPLVNPGMGISEPELIVDTNVTAIAAGQGFSLFLRRDGSLWATGRNNFGQLGDGTTNDCSYPEQILPSGVMAIAAGSAHSLFIKDDGSLWAMGHNSSGQLGDGTKNSTNLPEMIVASGVTAIAAGLWCSEFLKSDGSFWAMGDNIYGQFGDGTTMISVWPKQTLPGGVKAIAAGDLHTLLLKNDGSLWAMGDNAEGELGDGTLNQTNRPELIVASGVTAIAARKGHSLCTKNDGSLWAFGANNHGELGNGTFINTNRPQQIIAGPPDYNKITGQLLSDGKVRFTFAGIAGANYVLDRTFSLSLPNWIPQATNRADSLSALIFTNTLDPGTNNFWRIRSVP